ncbi:hypothetical protein BsWGS_23303 [Bradybaena similaris]
MCTLRAFIAVVVVVVVIDPKLLRCLLLVVQCQSLNHIEDIWVWCCRHLPPKGHSETVFLYDCRADGLLSWLALEEVTMLRGFDEDYINAFPASHRPSTNMSYFLDRWQSFHFVRVTSCILCFPDPPLAL